MNQPNVATDYIPTMLTIRECSDRTGISYGTIRRWIASGDVTAVHAGSKYYVNWNKFLAFLNGEDITA
jgi:excisionase family DNA binding protein